jgi:Xaa-Pro aminopeptidase
MNNVVQPPGAVRAEEGYRAIRETMGQHYPRFSEQEYQRRYRKIREEMAQRDISCLVMYSSGFCLGNQKNIHYVSNLVSFLPAYVFFPFEGEPTLFMLIYSFVSGGMAISNIEDVRWALGVNGPAECISELDLGNTKIGLVGEDILSSSIPHDHFEQLAAQFPGATFENFTGVMHGIMKIPSQEELEWFRKGAAYSDLGVQALVEAAEPGKTDNQIYAEIQRACLSQPNSVFYFAWIGSTPMNNPVCSYPFGLASGRTVQEGDIIMTEISGSYHGYAGQIIRAVTLGEPTSECLDFFNLAKGVYVEVQKVLKPGNTPQDVLKISQKFLDAGFSIQCPTIHGWGQRIIPPFADVPGSQVWAAELDVPFEEDQLIVIEPNPCTPDVKGGMFFGDLNRVTPNGGESLHKYPLELVVKK